MKTVAKLFADLIAWRWAPAAGLLASTTLFVLVVVGLVPTEIGVPVANTKFSPRTLSASNATTTETTTASFANATEASPVNDQAAPTPHVPAPVSEFGRRGFSPRLDRPDRAEAPAPAPPAPVVQPPPVPAPGGPISGIFSRIQGALRPGGPGNPANAAAAAAAAIASANAANAAAANAAAANAAPAAPVPDPNAPPPPGGGPGAAPPQPGTPPLPYGSMPITPPGSVPAPPPQ